MSLSLGSGCSRKYWRPRKPELHNEYYWAAQLVIHYFSFSSYQQEVVVFCQFLDVYNWLGFFDTLDYRNMISTVTENTKNISLRVQGACAVIAGCGRKSGKEYDKVWISPCCSLLQELKEFLNRHDGAGKASPEGHDSSATGIELVQRERRLYDKEIGR